MVFSMEQPEVTCEGRANEKEDIQDVNENGEHQDILDDPDLKRPDLNQVRDDLESSQNPIRIIEFPAEKSLPDNQNQVELLTGSCSESPDSDELNPTSVSIRQKDDNCNVLEDRKSTTIEFEPGTKCSDVVRAVEILKTNYRLSDVIIRKNMITWSCWNIADLVRGPHNETTLWKSQTLPRRMKSEPIELQDIIAEEMVEETEFQQEMNELCQKIDKKDKELSILLDQILRVARMNGCEKGDRDETPTVDEIDALENEPIHSEAFLDNDSPNTAILATVESPGKVRKKRRGNVFSRMLRALRRRLRTTPCNQTAKS